MSEGWRRWKLCHYVALCAVCSLVRDAPGVARFPPTRSVFVHNGLRLLAGGLSASAVFSLACSRFVLSCFRCCWVPFVALPFPSSPAVLWCIAATAAAAVVAAVRVPFF